eukprot:TRINITY_DN1492_c0_g1_i7.p1 TRINITY_DN1492_c0_g1~~TRINITY_DN1492_c0_g1_i7.p1  ORF type:complete len:343 (+),score=73.06 TRINITY_DN1492_c0_g1_i7:110-1138(+)
MGVFAGSSLDLPATRMEEEGRSFELTNTLLKNLASAKILKDHKIEVNSLDFSSDGKLLVSCDDNTLNLYDVLEGRKLKTLYNKVYKIDLVRFTHHNEAVICAAKSSPYYIFYWSIYENEIIKRFSGHKDALICLEMNPCEDNFLSSSRDQTVKLWSLSCEDQEPDGILDLTPKKTTAVVSFDPKGVVFAVAYIEGSSTSGPINRLRLYDLKKYSDGSFLSNNFECPEIRVLKFSGDGNHLLMGTSEDCLLLVDAYDLNLKKRISGFANDSGLRLEACFTPDSKFLISGSENGVVHIWDVEGNEVQKLEGHPKAVTNVRFNPKYILMATACTNIILWMPKEWK